MTDIQPKWLFEADMFLEGNPERMVAYAAQKGWETKWVKYVPFSGGTYNQYPDSPDQCVIAYGSLNLTRQLMREKKWVPTAWCDHDILKCTSYYCHFGPYLLQQKYAMYPLSEVNRKLKEIIEMFGDDGKIFIRPDNNYKSFSGIVVSQHKWDHWYKQNIGCYNLEPDLLCVVAKPQVIESEHRFVIADKKVVTGSKYIIGDRLLDGEDGKGFDDSAAMWAEEVAASTTFQPHRIYAIDVCTVNGQYRLMELGSINSCGLYGCDVTKAMDAMVGVAVEECQEQKEMGKL